MTLPYHHHGQLMGPFGKALTAWGLALLVLACSGPAWPAPPHARPRPAELEALQASLSRLDRLLAEENNPEALAVARKLMTRWESDPLYGWQVGGRLGLAMVRLGDAQGALPFLEGAVRAQPTDPVLHRNFAFALKTLGRRGRALTEYQTVVDLAPMDPFARLEFGQVLREFRDFSGAEKELLLAEHLCGQCLEARHALAALYLETGNSQAAIEPLSALLEADPDPEIRSKLGSCLLQAGRTDDALALLGEVPEDQRLPEEHRMIIQAEAAGAGSTFSRAYVSVLSGSGKGLPEAIWTDARFWAQVAAVLQRGGQDQDALAAITRAVDLAGGNALYRNNRAAILQGLGRNQDAQEEWDRAVALDPELKNRKGQQP